MSVLKLTLITCDKCGMTYASGDYKMATATDQRSEYKADGWVYRSPNDYCWGCK